MGYKVTIVEKDGKYDIVILNPPNEPKVSYLPKVKS